MSLNFSPETLPRCRPLLVEAGAAHVVIEITEHAAIDDYDALRADVDALREQGARLAVDDAARRLRQPPAHAPAGSDFMSFDVSLDQGIDQDRSRRALAARTDRVRDVLDADIIAEGIETEGEAATLRSLAFAPLGQGYAWPSRRAAAGGRRFAQRCSDLRADPLDIADPHPQRGGSPMLYGMDRQSASLAEMARRRVVGADAPPRFSSSPTRPISDGETPSRTSSRRWPISGWTSYAR